MEAKNLLTRLDACPPFICYYGAQMGKPKRPTLVELVEISGMASRTFSRIAHKTSWRGVTVEHMSQFVSACGIDILDPIPVMTWLANRKASGQLFEDFNGCRGQGRKMLETLNYLAGKVVLEKENHDNNRCNS